MPDTTSTEPPQPYTTYSNWREYLRDAWNYDPFDASSPPPQQPQRRPKQPPTNVGVWSGVKIGFGIFIVLPILIVILGIGGCAILGAMGGN